MQDVLIVGGGPTGFITALGLAQNGLKVTVIEAEAGIGDSPRAAVYHWSVLEGIDRLGILKEAEAIGFRKQDYTYLVHKTGERISYSLDVLNGHTAYPYNLHLGQHQLAEIAHGRLEALPNAKVRFLTRLTALDQDGDGVTATVETPNGVEEIRARWVIGADGAGSAVRRLIDLPFDGMTWPERFVATNVYYDFEAHGYARSTLVVDAEHGAIIAKLDNKGLWRCTYMEDASLPQDSFMDRLPGHYEHLLPGQGEYRVHQASPYRMHQRSASRYRVGRVVLAGDAAHATNPTGGLGLTSGLFDAYLLYPTLTAIVAEGADPSLLDSYSKDRRHKFVDIASPQASANKQLIYHANGNGQKLEDALAMLRRLPVEPDLLRERLMMTKGLESRSLVHA